MNKILMKLLHIYFILTCFGFGYASELENSMDNLELVSLQNQEIRRLTDFKGKIIIIAFWAEWCLPCTTELPELEKLQIRFSKSPVEMITIYAGNSAENAKKFVQKYSLHLPVYVDQDEKWGDLFKLSEIPAIFILNQERKLIYSESGYRQDLFEKIELQLNLLLNKQTVK